MNTLPPSDGARATQTADSTWSGHDRVDFPAGPEPVAGPAGTLRVVGRPDLLTAQKVEVSIILQAMLGTSVAAEYLHDNEVNLTV